jgi:hypothetical protein
MAANKTKPTEISVSAFIETLPDAARRTDANALAALMERASGEKPKMWGSSIIGFGSVHYTYESGREGDMPIACFSPRKSALVIYNLTRASGYEALLPKLGTHTMSGGCLHIKKLGEVDPAILETLLVKSVAAIREQHPD